jgi:hypothetical protein
MGFHKVGDGGCPYTASFLVDSRLCKWRLYIYCVRSSFFFAYILVT